MTRSDLRSEGSLAVNADRQYISQAVEKVEERLVFESALKVQSTKIVNSLDVQ